MSSSLDHTDCKSCGMPVRLTEQPRPITRADVCDRESLWREYGELIVAHAECVLCHAPYLALCGGFETPEFAGADGESCRERYPVNEGQEHPFVTLTHRHSFNDCPGDDDMPKRTKLRLVVDLELTPGAYASEVVSHAQHHTGAGASVAQALGAALEASCEPLSGAWCYTCPNGYRSTFTPAELKQADLHWGFQFDCGCGEQHCVRFSGSLRELLPDTVSHKLRRLRAPHSSALMVPGSGDAH